MIKRITLLVLSIALLTVTAMAEVNITSYQINNGNSKFSVTYENTGDNRVSIIAYDVSKVKNPTVNQTYIDGEATPVIGIWQELNDGGFELNIEDGYTGRLIVAIGCSDGTYTRILLKIEEDAVRSIVIPDNITEGFDADSTMRILTDNETITINKDVYLTNAVIDADFGTLMIGTTNVKGRVTFTDDGSITAEAGDTVILETPPDGEGKRNVGFIKGTAFTDKAARRTLRISHESGWERSATFENMDLYEGDLIFAAAVTNVSDSILTDGFNITVE